MRRRMLLVVAGVVIVGLGYVLSVRGANLLPPSGKPAFDGASTDLKHTQIVATLDTPMQKGKNVIWCASFQAAWKELQTKLAQGPVQLGGGGAVADALNRSYTPGPEIPPGSLYAVAGWEDTGLLDQVRKDVAKQFPGAPTPTFPGIAHGSFVAYSRLEAQAKFTLPYFQGRKPLEFTAGDGTKTGVTSFGIREEDDYAYRQLREQCRVLYNNEEGEMMARARPAPGSPRPPAPEYIVDLDGLSEPTQVIVAEVAPKATLAETLASVNKLIAEQGSRSRGLGINDVLLVPDVVWRLTHHFSDLEGKKMRNPALKGQRMDVAQEDLVFRLDRFGAELQAEAKEYCLPIPTHYLFDHPFLIVMRKRGETKPYFVMWVDNAELLTRG